MPTVTKSLAILILWGLVQACGEESNEQTIPMERDGEGVRNPSPGPQAGSGSESDKATEWETSSVAFEQAVSTFSSWTPVLATSEAFKSDGHGGVWVRSYISPTALTHIQENENPYPLPPQAMLAKAVVANADTTVEEANTVYFMRKEQAGFDPDNGDWSYALAKRVNGELKLDPSMTPKSTLCVSCHVKFIEFDNVKTVDLYKKSQTQ